MDEDNMLITVVALDPNGRPVCVYAGYDNALACRIRNRVGKGRGKFARFSVPQISRLWPGKDPEAENAYG